MHSVLGLRDLGAFREWGLGDSAPLGFVAILIPLNPKLKPPGVCCNADNELQRL